MRAALFIVFLLSLNTATAYTNTPFTFHAEKRAGAVIFVDECLSRGLTNAMSLPELRSWATNVIVRYRSSDGTRVAAKDVPPQLQMLQTNIPTCRFSYTDSTNTYYSIGPDPAPPSVSVSRGLTGEVESVWISWYIYGIIVGPETFKPKWQTEPWYHRKLADGIYLWHGYK
jgi:hypothetical protein